jgi:uroporphyrinogen III methyltransferase/synthase
VKVALTQTDPERLAGRLRESGFDVVECPLVRIEALEGPRVEAAEYDWVIVTSRNAVPHLLRRLHGPLPRVAAVGSGTAESLRAHGVEPMLVARRLVAELPRPLGRVLFAGAEQARDVLVRELDADFVPLYRTLEVRPDSFPEVDLVILASASAARSFAVLARSLPVVSIGPVTSDEGRALGLTIAAEAESHDLDGLVSAVKLAASRIASSRS